MPPQAPTGGGIGVEKPLIGYRLRWPGGVAPVAFEDDVVAGRIERNAGHERFHQEHAAAAGPFEKGVVGRVGQAIGSKAGALVADFHVHPMRRKPADKMDVFPEIFPIAVNNGVDQGFVHGQMDAENIALVPMLQFQFPKNFLEDTPACSRIAGKSIFALPGPRLIGRGHERCEGFGVQGSAMSTSTVENIKRPPRHRLHLP
jgi:hypothetical protein